MADPDVEGVGERVEEALERLAAAGPAVAQTAEQLVSELVGLYGVGLEKILGHLDDEALGALADDELVSGLLSLHGLHPRTLDERVADTIEKLAPTVRERGGDVRLVSVHGDWVTVEMRTDGCGCSAGDVRDMVDAAIRTAVPEVVGIQVEEAARPDAGLIPLESLSREPSVANDPTRVLPEDVTADSAQTREISGSRILLCRTNGDVHAYLDVCPACGDSLDGARVDDAALRCPSCDHHTPVEGSALELEPVPLVEDLNGLRLPAAAT